MPKPPHHTPILPPILTSLLQQPPSPCTLTRTATGFNIAWNSGNVIANKYEGKELELEKKSCKESVSIGMAHALEIISESTHVHPVRPLCERGRISLSVQTSQGFICPRHSESTNKSMSPPTQHKDVKQPPGEPPRPWSVIPMRGGTSNLDSVEQHPTAKECLPAQAKTSTVEKQRSSRKCSMAS
jgi:hypothetical protein